jgi:hypothetical protein
VKEKPKSAQNEARPSGRRRFEVLIFLTGVVTLALEVLASRIMTPYFGVSRLLRIMPPRLLEPPNYPFPTRLNQSSCRLGRVAPKKKRQAQVSLL